MLNKTRVVRIGFEEIPEMSDLDKYRELLCFCARFLVGDTFMVGQVISKILKQKT